MDFGLQWLEPCWVLLVGEYMSTYRKSQVGMVQY